MESVKPKIKAGDIFLSSFGNTCLAKMINGVQWLWSADNCSKYSHAGIIINEYGATFEALTTYKKQNVWKDYKGAKVKIVRPEYIVQPQDSLRLIMNRYEKKIYPFWRLPMHLIPPIAKISLARRPVCSELVGMLLFIEGIRPINFWGLTPDRLDDDIKIGRMYETIYEDII